ncbi:MAG TPA: FAD-dependent oxidoreductase [Rugosimonospora sp.]|nr:FAD-dependent oxidoreductase [Rugosimonospora sp.]
MTIRGPLVVVGGSLAGLRAIEAARAAGYAGRAVLVGAEPHLPYDRPPLSKEFLTPAASARYFAEEAHLRDDLGVELVLGAPAEALDTRARMLHVGGRRLPYEALIVATGSAPRTLPATAGLAGVVTLRTLEEARLIRERLHAGDRVVIVGAGFIGSEIASAARRYGNTVTIVEAAPVPLVRAAGPQLGRVLADLHHRNGTDLRLGVSVAALHGQGRIESVALSDGSTLDADLVIVGIGSAPATGWLAGSGVRLHDEDGGVICDEYLATSVPGVHAAGDVAHWPNPLMDSPLMRLENWTAAAEQGAVAARNAVCPAGRKPYRTVPYVWSDWYDSRIQFVGRPAQDEVRVVVGSIEGPRFLAVYRAGDRLAGALAVNEPGKIMKYRRLIQQRGSWTAALELYGAPAA